MAKTAERSSEQDVTINPIFRQHLAVYEYARKFAKDKVVLDLGCGEGYGTNLLASSAKKVVGIDYSKLAIERANKNYASDKTVFFRQDINRIVFPDESFELITAFQVIEHLYRPRILLSKIKKLLKAGGLFLLSTPNKKASIIEHPYHFREYNKEELRALLDEYFSGVEIYGLQFSQKAAAFRERRKKESQDILKLDPWKLHRLLPVFMRRILFDLIAEKLSKKIYREDKDLAEKITTSDYRVSPRQEILLVHSDFQDKPSAENNGEKLPKGSDLSIDLIAVCQKKS